MTLQLPAYDGSWPADDPDANFKAEVRTSTREDPLPTFEALSANTGIPLECLVRYVMVKWAAEGHEFILSAGPRMVRRMAAVVAAAEDDGSDAARLAAYEQLRAMIAWLAVPLDGAGSTGD